MYLVGIFTTCAWVLQPSWNCNLLESRAQEAVDTSTSSKTCSFYICLYVIYLFISLHVIFHFHVTFELYYYNPWSGHPSTLPVDNATVTLGRCLSLSLYQITGDHLSPGGQPCRHTITPTCVQCCDLCWVCSFVSKSGFVLVYHLSWTAALSHRMLNLWVMQYHMMAFKASSPIQSNFFYILIFYLWH